MGKEATEREIDVAIAELQGELDDAIDAGRDHDELIATFLLYVEMRRSLSRLHSCPT